jgi:transcription elongation factor Elf1
MNWQPPFICERCGSQHACIANVEERGQQLVCTKCGAWYRVPEPRELHLAKTGGEE